METRIAHGMRLDWLLKLLHKARRDKLLFGGKRQCSEPEMGRAELSRQVVCQRFREFL